MPARVFNRWWLFTVLGLSVLQVIVAVAADPYCVFGIVRYPKRNFEPNTRFLKVEYLRRHPEYDGFILGSSRAGSLDALAAARTCGPGPRYFNLSASLEGAAGMRRKLEWLVASRPVRQVVVLVDFDLQSVGTDPLDLLRQDHPLVSRAGFVPFYAKYLLFQPRILYLYGQANRQESRGEPWNSGNSYPDDPLYATRPWFDSQRLRAVTLNAVRHDLSGARPVPDPSVVSGLDEFRRMIAVLDQANIPRVLIVPPYRLDQFASFDPDALAGWMREIVAAAGSIWDFSGYNAVTANPANYVDPIHFDQGIGDRMLQRGCGHASDGLQGEFGLRVTAENMEEHAGTIRRQHAEALKIVKQIRW
jgi:hypothetical protein